MKIDQENRIQIRNCGHVTHAIDRDFDLMCAHVSERAAWGVRMQRVQDTLMTAMAIVLGSVVGWAVMR